MTNKKIIIENKEITINTSKDGDDYISLTDIARFKDVKSTGIIIANWLSTKYTLQFIGAWEKMSNPDFNVIEFDNIKNMAGSNGFILSSSLWIKKTKAIGIRSLVGRYNSGTFAHKDIAFEFATWISPEFKLFLIKEFQRLKSIENDKFMLEWSVKRSLTKINYRIHTDSVKNHIILPQKLSIKDSVKIYANEADILNMALFGETAQSWRLKNKNKDGNIRDYADVYQLICLANLEIVNAEFVKMGLVQKERILKLNDMAISQMSLLVDNTNIKKLIQM